MKNNFFYVLECTQIDIRRTFITMSTKRPTEYLAELLATIDKKKNDGLQLTPFEHAVDNLGVAQFYVKVIDILRSEQDAIDRTARLIKLYRTDNKKVGFNYEAVIGPRQIRVKKPSRHYIVRVTNMITGMEYYGVTKNLNAYWSFLRGRAKFLQQGRPLDSVPLTRDMALYGIDKFKFEEIDSSASRDEAIAVRVKTVFKNNTLYPNGYNIKVGSK